VFTTRPAGMTTMLAVIPFPTDPAGSATVRWHIELCCQPDHMADLGWTDISAAAGALVTVTAIGGGAEVWTDYI
jgi:hypothetical protein